MLEPFCPDCKPHRPCRVSDPLLHSSWEVPGLLYALPRLWEARSTARALWFFSFLSQCSTFPSYWEWGLPCSLPGFPSYAQGSTLITNLSKNSVSPYLSVDVSIIFPISRVPFQRGQVESWACDLPVFHWNLEEEGFCLVGPSSTASSFLSWDGINFLCPSPCNNGMAAREYEPSISNSFTTIPPGMCVLGDSGEPLLSL